MPLWQAGINEQQIPGFYRPYPKMMLVMCHNVLDLTVWPCRAVRENFKIHFHMHTHHTNISVSALGWVNSAGHFQVCSVCDEFCFPHSSLCSGHLSPAVAPLFLSLTDPQLSIPKPGRCSIYPSSPNLGEYLFIPQLKSLCCIRIKQIVQFAQGSVARAAR